jgi:hypothetical protein
MEHAVWVAKKNYICSLIKKVSDHYGGDDLEWLRSYACEVIKDNKSDLDRALVCFLDLLDNCST